MHNILVTGGAGYIGSHMVRFLIKSGHQPIVLDNLVYGHRQAVPETVPFYEGDIADVNLVTKIISQHNIAAVMHFSAFAYVGESVTDPQKYYENNLVKTLTLLKTMLTNQLKYFIFSSTCATYGNTTENQLSENHPQNPINPYGFTKLAVERALADYDQAYGLKSICLRYFNAAGADESSEIGESHHPETHLIPLALQTITGKTASLKVFGTDYPTPDGTCIRDYIHVNDLANAHLLALEYLFKNNQSNYFNLGSEHGFSVKEIINMCEKVSGKKVNYQFTDRRAGDPAILVANAKKAKEILKWQPKYSLEQIIQTAWNWELTKKY